MMSHYSYRLSFIFAITLHAVIIFFLFTKFVNSSRAIALKPGNNFINAVAINDRDIDNQVANKLPKKTSPASTQTAVKQPPDVSDKKLQSKIKMKKMLQEKLLLEQTKELAELKKANQTYRKKAAKQRQQQMQKMLQEQVLAEKQQLAKGAAKERGGQEDEHGSQLRGEVDKHKAMIIQAISSQWIYPEGVEENASCQLLINVAPGGVVLNVQMLRSSGNAVLDRSAQAAVMKASPLPVPEDQRLFNGFRTIKFKFNPKGIIGN